MAVVARLSNGDFVIGLEDGNVDRARDGHPFVKNLADFGGPEVTIYIVIAKDKAALAELLKDGMRPETQIFSMHKSTTTKH